MTARKAADRRLARLTKICLALPETTRRLGGRHAAFLVRAKIFAYYLDDHHGDGIVALCCKVAPGENADLVALDPARFYLPPYIGPRGWVGLRLDAGEIDWQEAAELAADSYRLVAPKRLAALVRGLPPLLLAMLPGIAMLATLGVAAARATIATIATIAAITTIATIATIAAAAAGAALAGPGVSFTQGASGPANAAAAREWPQWGQNAATGRLCGRYFLPGSASATSRLATRSSRSWNTF
jgi:hypothetical protein